MIGGFKLVCSEHLVGMKKAVRQGDTIVVSPAMYDLLTHADQYELQRLLASIELITIPKMDLLDLPMVTTMPKPDPEKFWRDLVFHRVG